MAEPTIGTKIKLDGEKEYKAALAEITSNLKVLKSEMGLLSATYEDNAEGTDALEKKNEVLNKTVEEQQKKVGTLREALENAAETYGENDKKTNSWKVSLNKAEAELIKMQRELDKNAEALKECAEEFDETAKSTEKLGDEQEKTATKGEKLSKSLEQTKDGGEKATGAFDKLLQSMEINAGESEKLGDGISGLTEKLGVSLPGGASKALNALGSVSGVAIGAATAVAAVVAAAVKAAQKLAELTNEVADTASEIKKLSSVTGISAEKLQEYIYAGERLGVSSDRIRDSLKETTNKMQEAQNGSEDVAKAYETLGIKITDAEGNLRNAEEVFLETIDALGEMENRTERDALAMDILSESAQELNPLIDAGSGALKKYADEAHEMGVVLSSEAVQALNEVDIAQKNVQATQEGIKNQMATELAPFLEEFYNEQADFIGRIGTILEESQVVKQLGEMLDTVTSLVPTFGNLTEPLGFVERDLKLIAQVVKELNGMLSWTASLLKTIFPYIFTNEDGVKATFEEGLEGLKPTWWDDVFLVNYGKTKIGTGKESKNAEVTESPEDTTTEENGMTYMDRWQQLRAASKAEGYTGPEVPLYSEWKKQQEAGNDEYKKWLEQYNAGKTSLTFTQWMLEPHNASGNDWFRGGRTLLSENGAEMAVLPQGTRILTAQETREAVGGDTYYVTIEARTVKEFDDIAKMAREKRRKERMGVANE